MDGCTSYYEKQVTTKQITWKDRRLIKRRFYFGPARVTSTHVFIYHFPPPPRGEIEKENETHPFIKQAPRK